MAKPSGALCNLSCSYCFYKPKEPISGGPTEFMSYLTLENYLKQMISAEPTDNVTISWQGGEPTLLGIEFYRKAIDLASKFLPKGKKLQWTMQTNGVLLDDEWCQFFRKNHYLVGISLDGPKEAHDAYRRNSEGQGTFERVIQAIDLLKRHRVDFNVLCCVHSANSNKGLKVYRFFRDNLGVQYMQFIPVVEFISRTRLDSNRVTSRSVNPAQWGQFLIQVFDEWVRHDVGKVFVPLFDWALWSWMGLESPACIFKQICGRALVVEHSGDVYSCDHFVDATHLVGNINDLALEEITESDEQKQFGLRKSQLPKQCLRCNVRFVCNGECPKNRFVAADGDGELGLNYLCEGYKNFFRHIDKPMRIMADLVCTGRFADEVMQSNYLRS
jgi:uncharacterized protein